MGYEILSNDLFDDGDNNKNTKRVRKGQPQRKRRGISPLVIHFLLILIVVSMLFGLYQWIFGDKDTVEEVNIVTFVGELEDFNESYSGDLEILTANFLLKTDNGNFAELSKTILIENFEGSIYSFNESILFVGTADSLEYGKNKINIASSNFELTSSRKTQVDLYFENISFDFTEGRIKFDDILNFEFEDTLVNTKNFNFTLTYDGKFSFRGVLDEYSLYDETRNLEITYKDEWIWERF